MGDMFWTDWEQARQRLRQSVILHNDKPFYCRDVSLNSGNTVMVVGYYCNDKKEEHDAFPADDPLFEKYRRLPHLGWMNMEGGRHALHLTRVPKRTSVHGYTDTNTLGYMPTGDRGTGYKIMNVMGLQSFTDMHKGVYPTLKECLSHIREDSSLAFGRQWAIACDKEGLKFLYRGTEKVGLFTDDATLGVFKKNIFYREEIMETPTITVNMIREL